MRKTTNTVALALALLFFAISAFAEQPTREFKGSFEPANNGERLLSLLVSLTDPESMELRMDQQPDNDGNIRDFSIFIQGASIGGFRVEKIAIESSFLELNRPSEWRTGERDSLKVRNVLRSNVELVALEKDINAALTSYAGGDWRRISVDLKRGMVSARAVRKRRVMSRSSPSSATLPAGGSSAMPQSGQSPGPVWLTSGCMGQV